jgi:hypothetical protein
MLIRKVIEDIGVVASNPRLQACIVSAMFQGVEEDHLWEALEDDVEVFPKQVVRLLFGADYLADENAPMSGLRVAEPAAEVVEEMITQVEQKVRGKLLGHNDDYCARCFVVKPCDCPDGDW